ncbi:MAG: arsinothricin resistance N-acetyltransferase ArsN1 family B [Longimicrobiales bacterium]
MQTRIRIAAESDAPQIAGIYRSIVTDTAISFEEAPPSADEIARRIGSTLESHPWLVCDRDGRIAGYAYATVFRTRPAYQWSVEVSAYTDREARRSGVARALYTSLFAILGRQGFVSAYAGIALPNEGSVGLHEALGFEPLGVYCNVGFKLGRWHDVGWWQLALCNPRDEPDPPLPFSSFCGEDACTEALAEGEALLRLD